MKEDTTMILLHPLLHSLALMTGMTIKNDNDPFTWILEPYVTFQFLQESTNSDCVGALVDGVN